MEVVQIQPVVDLRILIFPGEQLGDLCAVQALLQVGVHIGALVGYLLPHPPLGRLDDHNDRHKNRNAGDDDEGQLHVDEEHENGDEHQVKDVHDEVDDAV